MDLRLFTDLKLLQTHSQIIDELKKRGVVRTSNNPVGDYTEHLVCSRLSLQIQRTSQASYDGIDSRGNRYQIKGRRCRRKTGNVQFSVIRKLMEMGFDYLVAVAFNPDYSIRFAAQIPHSLVGEIASYRSHVNGHVPIFCEGVLQRRGVTDLTNLLIERRPE
jgi:hypothetical protein